MTLSEYTHRLMHIRRAAHVRRAAACAYVPERVLGIPLRPITPASWSLLVGTRSAFVSGRRPEEGDVRNFILFHLPEFDADRPRTRFWIHWLARVRTELALRRFSGSRRPDRRSRNLDWAISDIRGIVDEALADTPMPDERNSDASPTLAASLEVQFIDRAPYFDRVEARLDAEYLRFLNPSIDHA